MSAGGPTVHRFPDSETMCVAAAGRWVELAAQAVKKSDRFTVALSGGSTPRRLYELLAGSPFREKVAWEKVEFFWGDERAFPPDHPESNFYMAEKALLGTLDLRPGQIHRIHAEKEDRAAAASDYQAEIAKVFGVPAGGEPPSFDLVLLGLGADGHTASLFPDTEVLRVKAPWVTACYVPKLGAKRVTLTPTILNRAAEVIFLVSGPDKSTALAEVLEEREDAERLPAQIIRPVSGRVVWLADEAAAARLKRR
jgi:6-phosphogluconolactonase